MGNHCVPISTYDTPFFRFGTVYSLVFASRAQPAAQPFEIQRNQATRVTRMAPTEPTTNCGFRLYGLHSAMLAGGALDSCIGAPLGSKRRASLDKDATMAAYLGSSLDRTALPSELQEDDDFLLGFSEDIDIQVRKRQPQLPYRTLYTRAPRLPTPVLAGGAASVRSGLHGRAEARRVARADAGLQREGEEDRHALRWWAEGASGWRGGCRVLQPTSLQRVAGERTRAARLAVHKLPAERESTQALWLGCVDRQLPGCSPSWP